MPTSLAATHTTIRGPVWTPRGTLSVDGDKRTVSGTAWFDHQWGALDMAVATGWDWYALQLDDQREIMLFTIRDDHGVESSGSPSPMPSAKPRRCLPRISPWLPRANGRVPADAPDPLGWDITVGDLELSVDPVMQEQEVPSTISTIYWEGAATVSGDATGRAYVELTGYCG